MEHFLSPVSTYSNFAFNLDSKDSAIRLLTYILNPQQPGDKQAGKQDGAKQKPKANAAAGQENKATNKNAAEKNKEEDPQAALEKDMDELRKAIDGEFKLNSSWMCFGFSLFILSRFSLPSL